MDALENIFTRRSIREFTAEGVTEQQVANLLKAAMAAPSARNEQPWQFLVLNDRLLLDEIANSLHYAKMCLQAPLAIIPCIDKQTLQCDDSFLGQDMSAAAQNILLAAHAMGLGSVWVGIYPRIERITIIKEMFNLPESVIPFCIIPIGHTNVVATEVDRYDLQRVHFNAW
jgi:nitroreductase